MLVRNKIGESKIKEVILRSSRVEIRLTDGSVKHYYPGESIDPNDELTLFHRLVRNKFLDGRDRHQGQGSKVYKADTIWELQGELLDLAGYGSVMYGYLSRLKESARVVLTRLLSVERGSQEKEEMIEFKVEAIPWDNLVSDLEAIAGRK